LRRYFCKQIV